METLTTFFTDIDQAAHYIMDAESIDGWAVRSITRHDDGLWIILERPINYGWSKVERKWEGRSNLIVKGYQE